MWNTTIEQVNNIIIHGEKVLEYATIVSNFGQYYQLKNNPNRSMYIEINGSVSDYFDLVCSIGDECTVKCLSNHVCDRIRYHCQGDCIIDEVWDQSLSTQTDQALLIIASTCSFGLVVIMCVLDWIVTKN